MEHHRAIRGKSGLVALLSVTLASSLTLSGPALAAPAPDDHGMGSQIRRNEGGDPPDPKPLPVPENSVPGIDVSNHQGKVNWKHHFAQGKRFAYMKATEGTTYTSPSFPGQYTGSVKAGLIHGAYHFALPNASSGAKQANYFVDHGGGWSPDGKTLPGALDIEYNPYGDNCYGMRPAAMGKWITEFSDTYQKRTGRHPVIYTSTKWWNKCAQGKFAANSPLWVARYGDAVGGLPKDWTRHTIWQYSSTPIDQNMFNGDHAGLMDLVKG